MADARIGIVSWNTATLLDRCLGALVGAVGDLEAEVVVVDNASADDSADVAARHPGVRVVRNPENVGYARAMNQALAGSTAPVLVALNPDTEPPPGSITALVAELHALPQVAVLAPRLLDESGRLQHSVYRFPSLRSAAAVCFVPPRLQQGALGKRLWLEGAAPHDDPGEIDWAIGAVHVIRAAAVDPQHVYSERWFMYAEDLELCWRVRQVGWKVWFDPAVEIPHVGNAAGAQAWGLTRARRYWEASYDFYRQARGAAAVRAYALVNTVGCALHAALNAAGAVTPGSRGRARRLQARALARVLPVHARSVVAPRPPR